MKVKFNTLCPKADGTIDYYARLENNEVILIKDIYKPIPKWLQVNQDDMILFLKAYTETYYQPKRTIDPLFNEDIQELTRRLNE